MRTVQSLASDHFHLLGERSVPDPPLSPGGKLTNWNTRLEVLGWVVDTEALTEMFPPHTRFKLHALLAEWPSSRMPASSELV